MVTEKPLILRAYKVKVVRAGKRCYKCGEQFRLNEIYNVDIQGQKWHTQCAKKGLIYED